MTSKAERPQARYPRSARSGERVAMGDKTASRPIRVSNGHIGLARANRGRSAMTARGSRSARRLGPSRWGVAESGQRVGAPLRPRAMRGNASVHSTPGRRPTRRGVHNKRYEHPVCHPGRTTPRSRSRGSRRYSSGARRESEPRARACPHAPRTRTSSPRAATGDSSRPSAPWTTSADRHELGQHPRDFRQTPLGKPRVRRSRGIREGRAR